jgi:hypothetical protein
MKLLKTVKLEDVKTLIKMGATIAIIVAVILFTVIKTIHSFSN